METETASEDLSPDQWRLRQGDLKDSEALETIVSSGDRDNSGDLKDSGNLSFQTRTVETGASRLKSWTCFALPSKSVIR